MRFRSIQVIVLGITFCIGIGFAFALITRTPPVDEHRIGEGQRSPRITDVPANIAMPTTLKVSDEPTDDTRLEEFTDAKRIGRPGRNKIEIRCYSQGSERFAEVKFFARSDYGAWLQTQSFKFPKDGVTDCNPIVEDFNHDGLRDFAYQSDVAARGANVVQKLFIYDKTLEQLVYIKNSEEYPNLAYNKKLNCIDSFIVTGSTETVFLHLEGDELIEFASVSNGLERVVTHTDHAGEVRVLSRKKYDEDDFSEAYRRFSTYDPPR